MVKQWLLDAQKEARELEKKAAEEVKLAGSQLEELAILEEEIVGALAHVERVMVKSADGDLYGKRQGYNSNKPTPYKKYEK